MTDHDDKGLGRRVPNDWLHTTRYPLRAVAPETVATVEQVIRLPRGARPWYDQGDRNGCVGACLSQLSSVNNSSPYGFRRYDWRWLWDRAKEIDPWGDTNPGDNNGTALSAGFDVLRRVGHVRVFRGEGKPPDPEEGVAENRWARSVDEIRTALAAGIVVAAGTNWYRQMGEPEERERGEWWVKDGDLGMLNGGHAYLLAGASDRRQALFTPNSWGADWPMQGEPGAWIPYRVFERLLSEDGEAGVVTDRPGAVGLGGTP